MKAKVFFQAEGQRLYALDYSSWCVRLMTQTLPPWAAKEVIDAYDAADWSDKVKSRKQFVDSFVKQLRALGP